MKEMAIKHVKNINDDVMCFRAGSGAVVEHECHIVNLTYLNSDPMSAEPTSTGLNVICGPLTILFNVRFLLFQFVSSIPVDLSSCTTGQRFSCYIE